MVGSDHAPLAAASGSAVPRSTADADGGDFETLLNSDRREAGFHIRRHVKQPPHYAPPHVISRSFRSRRNLLRVFIAPFFKLNFAAAQ